MAETFLHDESGVTSFVSEVREYLQDYNDHIVALETLLNTISSKNILFTFTASIFPSFAANCPSILIFSS